MPIKKSTSHLKKDSFSKKTEKKEKLKKGKNENKTKTLQRKILITAALPYANASIHIGHLIEYIEADIVTRFLRLSGEDVVYVCASDTHGTPIEVNAAKLGVTPEEMVNKFNQEHKKDFSEFFISFDDYYLTHSPENKKLSEYFFTVLKKKGYITKKFVDVMFCPRCARALPDRYVRGTCPNCGTADQYGDVCESCGMTHKGIDLLDPKCSLCGTTPKRQQSEHYFFTLSAFSVKLRAWLKGNEHLQPEIKKHIFEWLDKGLEDWCISRDAPYFGFLIPGEKSKYFYVWLDAPIGYISTTQHLTSMWGDYWKKEDSNIIHFIGKDIIYFHFLFWPAILMAVGFHVPNDIVVHGFLTVNGKKMSKSRGTFFTARDFLKLYPPEYLRFYYAHHLDKNVVDINLDFNDFQAVVNNQLVANIANFCYRVLPFIEKNYNGKVDEIADDPLIHGLQEGVSRVLAHYTSYALKDAVAEILSLSDKGNLYFQTTAPWKDKEHSRAAVGLAANLVRVLSILLAPILPMFSSKIQQQLCEKDLTFSDIAFDRKIKVKNAAIVFTKIEKIPSSSTFPLDLRVGKVIAVEDHPNADSLYLLTVDVGSEKRKLVAGLKRYIARDVLLGKNVLVCMNIIPATIRGVESKGMVLAADDGAHVCIVEAPKSLPGMVVSMEGHTNSSEPLSFEQFKKLNLQISGGKVVWEGTHLRTDKEDIVVKDVKDGGSVR